MRGSTIGQCRHQLGRSEGSWSTRHWGDVPARQRQPNNIQNSPAFHERCLPICSVFPTEEPKERARRKVGSRSEQFVPRQIELARFLLIGFPKCSSVFVRERPRHGRKRLPSCSRSLDWDRCQTFQLWFSTSGARFPSFVLTIEKLLPSPSEKKLPPWASRRNTWIYFTELLKLDSNNKPSESKKCPQHGSINGVVVRRYLFRTFSNMKNSCGYFALTLDANFHFSYLESDACLWFFWAVNWFGTEDIWVIC